MQISVVKQILSDHFDATVDGDDYRIEPECKLVVMVSHDSGVMQVPKVHQVIFGEMYVTLTTEDDRYYITPDVIFGLKGEDPDLERDEKRPGFRT